LFVLINNNRKITLKVICPNLIIKFFTRTALLGIQTTFFVLLSSKQIHSLGLFANLSHFNQPMLARTRALPPGLTAFCHQLKISLQKCVFKQSIILQITHSQLVL